jgi:glycosyltransferase involved in cell wall biosynthesis
VRALVVSNMLPDRAHPERGSFVRDQVSALRELDGVQVELIEFPPGGTALVRTARALRSRRHRGGRPDVVHAHFGLTAWPALAAPARAHAVTLHGTDVHHPRTRLATFAALPFVDLLGVASGGLAEALPRRFRARAVALPCGVDIGRFRPIDRERARAELGLPGRRACLLFAADPARLEKRHDRALALARSAGVELHTLGGVPPAAVPLWVNAANAVLVPSEREGFGLAALEALACDVPVLATPVGIHAEALAGIAGALCAPFDLHAWSVALAPALSAGDPRIHGKERAQTYSSRRMAERVREEWEATLQRSR